MTLGLLRILVYSSLYVEQFQKKQKVTLISILD